MDHSLPCCGSAESCCACPEAFRVCCREARSEVTTGLFVHWLVRGRPGDKHANSGSQDDRYFCKICCENLTELHPRNLLARNGVPLQGLNTTVVAAHTRDKSGDHHKALEKHRSDRGLEEPGAGVAVLFYQYVRPRWNADDRQLMMQWFEETCSELRIHGRAKVAFEGVNCCLSGTACAGQELEKRLKSDDHNPFAKYFQETLVKMSPSPASAMFSKLKVFTAEEIVGFGIEVNDFEPVQKLTPAEWHEKMQEPGIVMIDVRNYYETRIGRFVAPGGRFVGIGDQSSALSTCQPARDALTGAPDAGTDRCESECGSPAAITDRVGGTETLDPATRYFTDFPDWVMSNKQALEGKTLLVY
eukprot:TRINITY_DN80078_c0_g1_i1.p2 TRINITY_DN80078_c0_g1~~TRINITY_DN80078_c0_g1_i1.p2  ORF type:complete len:359 (-),score=50.19 TRINITY_DN80078_c0_g1_i1:736-1812(-)